MRNFLSDLRAAYAEALLVEAIMIPASNQSWPVTIAAGAFAGVALNHARRAIMASHEMPPKFQKESKKTRFLDEDGARAIQRYWKESTIAPSIPYVEAASFIDVIASGRKPDVQLRRLAGIFHREQWLDPALNDLAAAGRLALVEEGRLTRNTKTIRVSNIARSENGATLTIQEAAYEDQARSNLILDFDAGVPSGQTLRSQLHIEHGPYLPKLSDKRLANTIGCAAMVFTYQDQKIVPFLQLRSREVAVMSTGGWHCTASGAAEWPADPANTPVTLEGYITDDMHAELEQEAGIMPNEVSLEPVAICRELARGGKPQIFYLGATDLSFKELVRRSETARRRQVDAKKMSAAAEPVETRPRPYLHEPRLFSAADEIDLDAVRYGFTNEAAACLYYFFKLMDATT